MSSSRIKVKNIKLLTNNISIPINIKWTVRSKIKTRCAKVIKAQIAIVHAKE